MNAVLKYPGAKNKIASWIIKHFPRHDVYVEPFFGSGAVFFQKDAAYNEIINDIDDDVYNFFKVLRENPEELIKQIMYTPYSRTEYQEAYGQCETISDLEKARRFAVKCWLGFGCGNRYKNGYRRGLMPSSPNPAKAFCGLPDTLQKAVMRLKNAQIEHMDAIDLIEDLKGRETLIYIDPPYLLDTRKKYLYNHELEDKEHIRLLETIKKSDCSIVISGYDNELYNSHLNGWTKYYKSTTAECSVRRTETLWLNFDEQIKIEV